MVFKNCDKQKSEMSSKRPLYFHNINLQRRATRWEVDFLSERTMLNTQTELQWNGLD